MNYSDYEVDDFYQLTINHMTDLNKVAEKITLLEGKKVNMNIAQVKEVLRIIFTHLGFFEIIRIYFKYHGKH